MCSKFERCPSFGADSSDLRSTACLSVTETTFPLIILFFDDDNDVGAEISDTADADDDVFTIGGGASLPAAAAFFFLRRSTFRHIEFFVIVAPVNAMASSISSLGLLYSCGGRGLIIVGSGIR